MTDTTTTAQPLGRVIARHTLSWGLLAIPVAIHSATGSPGPKRRQVRRSDGSPIKMVRTAEADGQPVAWADIATAIEGPGGWVIAERDTVEDTRDRVITLHQTADPADLTGIVRDGAYILRSDAATAVRTLSDALAATGLVGIVTYTMRSVTRLGLVRPDGAGGLVLDGLEWPDAHRHAEPADTRTPTPAELATAVMLVEGMRAEWDPSEWASPQAARLTGHAATADPIPTADGTADAALATSADALIAALQASVAATRAARGATELQPA